VAAFLDGRIDFPGIARVVAETLQSTAMESVEGQGLEALIAFDQQARATAEQIIGDVPG